MKTKATLKNVFAMLTDEIVTVDASFNQHHSTGEAYTWKCMRKVADTLSVGSPIVVQARGKLKVAYVTAVHADCQLEQPETIAYSWVVTAIDMLAHKALLDREEQIVNKIQAAQRKTQQAAMLADLGITLDDVGSLALTEQSTEPALSDRYRPEDGLL